jgi:hypothetical protein
MCLNSMLFAEGKYTPWAKTLQGNIRSDLFHFNFLLSRCNALLGGGVTSILLQMGCKKYIRCNLLRNV